MSADKYVTPPPPLPPPVAAIIISSVAPDESVTFAPAVSFTDPCANISPVPRLAPGFAGV